jgi:hypothetical protein
MAKKTRRPNLPQETLERARREMAQGGIVIEQPIAGAGEAVAKPKTVAGPRKMFSLTTEADLRNQYAYVLLDLKNMALLAAGLIAVLIVLSFVI